MAHARRLLKTVLLLSSVSGFAAATQAAEPINRAAAMFGARESVGQIDLSPDGSTVVYVAPAGGKGSVVNIAGVAGGTEKGIVATNGAPDRLSWCNFASDERLICQIRAVVDYQGLPIGISRTFALNRDGKEVKQLDQRNSDYDTRLRQFGGAIVDWLPDDGNAVLTMREYVPEGRTDTRIVRNKSGLGVDKIDLRTNKTSVVQNADSNATDFISDGHGNIRIKEAQRTQAGDSQMAGKIDYFYRKTGSSNWEKFGSYDTEAREGMVPLAIDAGIDSAYVLKKLDGRTALYRVKLDGSMATELAYANDRVDVDNVVRIGRGAKVIGVTFAEEQRHVVYFDPEYKKLAASLSKAIPNLPLVQFSGASRDEQKLLIFAGSDADPGRYYLYDKGNRSLNEIMLARPQLEGVKLATVKAMSYPAADGAMIPAYLTLPPGKESAKGLPAIMLPHGGPSARDEWGFDWLAQFLANQGYAVLQPNYRGSEGYGDEWLKDNGFRSWQTSIGDVTAGAKWMVGQGIADPAKLAILGWSYGGYAALQSGVAEPDLYKAIVAIAPVTDLDLVKQDSANFTNHALVEAYIGSGPHIQQGSPLQNASRIKAPVLMFHGDRDLNVAIRHSQLMDVKLHEAGKKSELIEFPGLEHSLIDSNARAQMLTRIAAFLKTSLPQ